MSTISYSCKLITKNYSASLINPAPFPLFSTFSFSSISRLIPHLTHSSSSLKRKSHVVCSSSNSTNEEAAVDEWLERLPDKEKPLYAHSLPCVEAWLKSLSFHQSKEDRAVWFVEKPDWNAQLFLDVTDLCIRYLKSGRGNLEKDVERRFSYALSREDIQNAILGGP